jgi:hypothetical protein
MAAEEPCESCGTPTTTRINGTAYCSGSCAADIGAKTETYRCGECGSTLELAREPDPCIDCGADAWQPADEALHIEPFAHQQSFRPRIERLRGHNCVRFTATDHTPGVTFLVWLVEDNLGMVPDGSTTVEITVPAPVATTLAENAGETRFEADVEGGRLGVSAVIGQSGDAEPATDGKLVEAPTAADGGVAVPDDLGGHVALCANHECKQFWERDSIGELAQAVARHWNEAHDHALSHNYEVFEREETVLHHLHDDEYAARVSKSYVTAYDVVAPGRSRILSEEFAVPTDDYHCRDCWRVLTNSAHRYDVGNGTYRCPECLQQQEAEERSENNHDLGEFPGGEA